MRICGVYIIQNIINEHFYIGHSRDIEGRICVHSKSLERHCHHSKYLQRAYDKYGEDNFVYDILVACDESLLELKEQELIDKLHPQYNVNLIVSDPPMKGKHHSKEYKIGMSKRMLGNQYAVGTKHSDEDRRKTSERMKGNKFNAWAGKKHSEETKKRMSLAQIGNQNSVGCWKGRKHSEETKRRMSESQKKRYESID
jgi:group I intron endonuclease